MRPGISARRGDLLAISGERQDGADDHGGIYDGTVGWNEGNGAKHYDSSGPILLVKVTLFAGASPNEPPRKDGRARGRQILCRTSGPMHTIPPDGAQVHVSIPAGRWETSGGGMILGMPNEARRYADEHTFLRVDTERGRISLFTTDDQTPNGKSIFLQVKKEGLEFVCPFGKLTFRADGVHFLHSSGARIDLGAVSGMPAPLDALGSYCNLSGATMALESAILSLGPRSAPKDPVAKTTPTLALFSVVSSALVALGAYATAAALPDTDPSKAAALVAALANVTAALTAVAGAITAGPATIASQSTLVS